MKTKNNLRFIRLRRNITIDRLVEMTDIPKTTLHRIENEGSQKVLNKYRSQLATALNCKPEELDDPDIGDGIPVVGEIKFKAYVKLLPEAQWKETDYVEGLPETAHAVRIATPNLAPAHFHNDMLYFDSIPQEKPSLFLNKQCIVQLPKGNLLLAWLTPGTKRDHYLIHHYGAHHVGLDQKVVKAYPILHIKRG
jgi:transcriptional regulator with XRE-family HTH domain